MLYYPRQGYNTKLLSPVLLVINGKMTADEISLRPLSLRPGGGVNPFAGFALGAGLGLKNKVSRTSISSIMRIFK